MIMQKPDSNNKQFMDVIYQQQKQKRKQSKTVKMRESRRWYLGDRDPAMNHREDEGNLKQKRKRKLNTRRRSKKK